MNFLAAIISLLRNLFAPFPHISKTALKPFVPFLAWYVLLRGLLKVIDGLRDVSQGVHYSNLPKIFVNLLDIAPSLLLVSGILSVVVGVLYLMAFGPLAKSATRQKGWQAWTVAAAALTLVKLYEIVFLHYSVGSFIASALIGWYLIFEFERVILTSAPSKRTPRRRRRL